MTPPVRLTSLTLEKYGPFENRVLNFRSDAALHVVFGRNEAGKSVTLRALADLICGFPPTIKSDDCRVVRFKSGDLRLAATMLHADGRTFSFRRRAGRQNTLLGVTDTDKCDEATFRQFVGMPERKDFESEFGLTAEALRSGGQALLAAGGRLAETLAAGSAHLSVLNKVRSQLQDDAAALYLPRHKKRLNEVGERYLTAGSQFRAAVVQVETLKRAREVLEDAETRRAQINERHRLIERRRKLLERAKRTHVKLHQLADSEERLASFATSSEVDETTLAGWMKACERKAELARLSDDVQEKLAEIDNAVIRLKLAPDLVANDSAISHLVGQYNVIIKAREDLPKREEAARIGKEELEKAAQALGVADAQALIERLPSDIALTRMRECLRARAALDAAHESAQSRLVKAQVRLRALEQSGAEPVDDPSSIARTFAAFADLPAVSSHLRKQASDLEQRANAIALEAERLLPSMLLNDLLRAPLPDVALIEVCMRRAAALSEERGQIDRDLKLSTENIDANERALRVLTREGAVATRDDLAAARERRDASVATLESKASLDANERTQHFVSLRTAIADADQTADVLLTSADSAARRQQITDALTQAQAARVKLDERRVANDANAQVAEAEWQSLWRACGLAPLAPAQMRDWRVKASGILDKHENLASVRATFAAARDEFLERMARLRELAPRVSVEINGRESADELTRLVRSALDELQKAWVDGRQRVADLASVANEIADAQNDLLQLDTCRLESAPIWREAVATLCLREDAGAMEAEDALRIWGKAIADLLTWRRENERVMAIRRDIEAFEAKAEEACARFSPELSGETPHRIVETLTQRLSDARSASAKLEQIEEQRSQLLRARDKLLREQAAVSDVLATAAARLAVAPELLLEALAHAAARRKLMDYINMLRRDIVAAGDGHSSDELAQEQDGLDFDALDAELASLEAEGKIVLGEIDGAAIEREAARKALAELEAGRDAPSRMLEQKQAASELLDIARDWLLRMGAAKLAGVAMEQHRRRNQDPVIAAASGLFAKATGGAFSGVVVDLDDDGQPLLKGARRDGARLTTGAMSEGTCDQLFLALRLALLEQRSADPMPFIGDDLLASFDDERTAHTIDMMSEFGMSRQTVLFTHHGHVVEAARARLGARVDVVDLGL